MQASATYPTGPMEPTFPDLGQPQRPFQCSTCKRSFTRADHLTRHVRAHTRQKPYICPVCSKRFARIDLLKRHAANHDASNINSKRQRRGTARESRVVQACEACSQSHLRCEDSKPCSRCIKKNIPCQVPEMSPTDERGMPEQDAVHAAHDLLHLSIGMDNPSSSLATTDSQSQTSAPAEMESLDSSRHLSFSGASEVPDTTQASDLADNDEVLSLANGMSPPPSIRRGVAAIMRPCSGDPVSSSTFFGNAIIPFDDTSSIDPSIPNYFRSMPPLESFLSGHTTPRGIMDTSFDLDVDLTDLDLGFLDQYNLQVPFTAGTPSTDAPGPELLAPDLATDGAMVRTEAFKQSVWRYLPQRHRDFGGAEERNLAYGGSDRDGSHRSHMPQRRAIAERLSRVSRDRLMALVLGTCSPENINRIASAFPSIELLDGLIQYFLTSPSFNARSWLHMPTFSLKNLKPELLAGIASAGAVLTPDLPLRKLGFALHEASRTGQAKAFEEDNSSIRDLQHLQTFLLLLEIGMWSGISRKMEIAESFLQPMVTMLRRGGRFRRSTWKEISPSENDEGSDLERKWNEWVQQETFLRLVYRTFEHDRQSSMALLKPPLISYLEMQLPLPCPENLWQANSATVWKSTYFSNPDNASKRPSPDDCFLDLERLSHHECAGITYLHMVWGMVWEFRQMNSMSSRSRLKTNNSLILSSRHQELTRQLEDFRISSPQLSKSAEVMLELMFIHLNAPLDEIQLFAGIEGQEEARSSYPLLNDWIKGASARQALWHAGQILRAAGGLHKSLLCHFNAIAVYHAGLVLWAYGFLKRASCKGGSNLDEGQEPVILNGEDSLSAKRFITLDRGLPAIKSPGSQRITHLSDIVGVMDSLTCLLQATHNAGEGPSSSLVGNLVQLLEGLRSATK